MAVLSTLKNNRLLSICLYILRFILRATRRTLIRIFWICVGSRLAFQTLIWLFNYLVEGERIHASDDSQTSSNMMGATHSRIGFGDPMSSTNLEHEQEDLYMHIQRQGGQQEEPRQDIDSETKRRRHALLKQLWTERQQELDDLEEFRRRITEQYNICKNWIRLQHELPEVLKRDPKDPKAAIREARRSLESGLRQQRRILSDITCDIARQVYRATEGQRNLLEEDSVEAELVEEKALRFMSQLEKVRFQIYIDERKRVKKMCDARQDSAIDMDYDEQHEAGPAVIEEIDSHDEDKS